MNKLGLGIIGCGKQAAKHIASLRKIPGVQITVADIEPEFARNLAKKSGLSWVPDPADLFEDRQVGGIVICTPTRTHAPYIKKAISAHKDTFCEKPLSDSLEEVSELQRLALRSKQVITIGYIYRYVPIFEEGFSLFRKDRTHGESLVMGRPLSAFFRLGGRGDHQVWKHQKNNGGGAINEMLVHMIDLANWYFGPLHDIEVISSDLRCPQRTIQSQKIMVDAEDFIFVKARGANDIEIHCQADLITPSFCQFVEIQAENGSFMGSIQNDFPSYLFLKESRGGYGAGKTEFKFGQRNILDIQMMAFVQAILEKQQPDRNTIEDSLQLIQIMDAIRYQIEDR